MRALRAIGNAALWVVAALGLVSALVWGATQLGWIQPLVVISGSMSPGIATGDLLVDRPQPTDQVQVGEVTSIYSELTGNLVTHRVVAIEPGAEPGTWDVRMKGDANDSEDGGTYVVGATVLQPWLQVPGGGHVVTTLTRPSVALPLAITLLSLLGLSLLPSSAPRGRHASDADQDGTGDDGAGSGMGDGAGGDGRAQLDEAEHVGVGPALPTPRPESSWLPAAQVGGAGPAGADAVEAGARS